MKPVDSLDAGLIATLALVGTGHYIVGFGAGAIAIFIIWANLR